MEFLGSVTRGSVELGAIDILRFEDLGSEVERKERRNCAELLSTLEILTYIVHFFDCNSRFLEGSASSVRDHKDRLQRTKLQRKKENRNEFRTFPSPVYFR